MGESVGWLLENHRCGDGSGSLNGDDGQMSYQEHETVREVRYVGTCGSPLFWGVVLVAVGIAGLLPYHLSRYVWPAVAVVAGLWLLFGPLDWRWGYRRGPFDDRYDRM